MEYISTRNSSKTFNFKEVFIKGLADDGGLFIPKSLNKFSEAEIDSFKKLSYQDLAKNIIFSFIGDFMSENDLSRIIDKSYSVFREKNVVKLIKVGDRSVLELFHGPTLAFKDVAMQLLGNFYEYYLNNENEKINIVVATSGDTGAAAIDAIKGKKNVNIFVLHPHNRVSSVQRKLMTTGKEQNVINIAINGNFDDCQNLVKSMFADKIFSNEIRMSGVNSINWARIIAQSVYYFYSYFLVEDKDRPLNFSVPTGNFGDVYAGYLAKKMGLPINKLVVATNQNDILHRAISKGSYEVEKVTNSKISMLANSLLTAPSKMFPAYSLNTDSVTVLPKTINNPGQVFSQYIRYPKDPKWTYVQLVGGEPSFDSSSALYQDFEIPLEDEPTLVNKILQYAGVSIREIDIATFGNIQEQEDNQQQS